MKNSCKGCNNRSTHCHVYSERYAAYVKENEAQKQKERDAKCGEYTSYSTSYWAAKPKSF